MQLGVEFGSKLITLPEDEKVVKLQCTFLLLPASSATHSRATTSRLGHCGDRVISRHYPILLPRRSRLLTRIRRYEQEEYASHDPPATQFVPDTLVGFMNARNWLADVREHADPNLTCILVANKVDLVEEASASSSAPTGSLSSSPRKSSIRSSAKSRAREVTTEEGELWAKEEGLLFVEASAKSGQNVEKAFVEASRDILDKIRRGVFDDDRVRLFGCLSLPKFTGS